MNVILFGAPGAGKGTQGELLAAGRGLERLSTGDLLRDAVRRKTPLGLRAQAVMAAGELVPDDVILGIVRDFMAERPTAQGFIFDGFPRTVAQAEALDKLLRELDRPLDAVVVLEVADDELVRRLTGRRSCSNCGAIYHMVFEPPAEPGVCDRCGGELTQRADDQEDTVRRRLEVYREQTAQVLAHYARSDAPVHELDGARPPEVVQADMLRTLGL
ncbi:MAG: adenylate kinase [Gemmatimonadota bacterium]